MPVLSPPRDSGIGSPVPRDPRSGGGGRGWVELTTAGGDIEAHLLTGRLAAAGIETSTVVDRSGPGTFLYGGHDPWAPVSVLVKRVQLDEARLVLAELAYEAPSIEPRRGAGSSWKGAVVWWSAAIALAIAFTVLGVVQMIERCERDPRCAPVTREDRSGSASDKKPATLGIL